MVGLVIASVVFIGLAVLLRWIADRENPTFAVFIPAQMHALVTTKSNKVTDVTKGGGNVVDVIHSIPGKKLNKSSTDPMNWCYEDGKESRGILYYLGIQIIWFFRYLRLNDVRTFRWGRKDEESEYRMQAKSQQTRYVFFSGQHDIEVKEIETKGNLKINLRFNLLYEELYPIRVRLRTADPYAVLSLMVSERTIGMVSGTEPEEFMTGEVKKQELVAAIEGLSDEVVEKIGICIKAVDLVDVTYDVETRRLFELKAKTDRENAAAITIAKRDKRVTILANDADADRVERVIKPAAENDRTVAVRFAEAYENNKVVTTYALGGTNTMIPLGK